MRWKTCLTQLPAQNKEAYPGRGEGGCWTYFGLGPGGFAPTLVAVHAMADKLLAACGRDPVGVHWPRNFVNQTDSLVMHFNRAYNRQRVLCKDPKVISSWFELVEETKAKYGIIDDDVFNFNEAGFMMGIITT